MSRAKDQALADIAQLAETAPRRFAPLRMKAKAGELAADRFHEMVADLTADLLRKIDAIHYRRIAPRIWAGAEHREIREAFERARSAIMEASLDA